jgi:hypothetical protein
MSEPAFLPRSRPHDADFTPIIGAMASRICTERGCVAIAEYPCSYSDRNGVTCPTAWCKAHIRLFRSEKYCRRHASTVAALRALSQQPGELHDLPPVEKRWASLLRWMTKELDEPIRDLMDRRRPLAQEPLTATGDVQLAEGSRGTWTWRWGSGEGADRDAPVVTISVDEASDDVVVVTVNNQVVHSEKPPWILHRQQGESVDPATDASEREGFVHRIVSSIAAVI